VLSQVYSSALFGVDAYLMEIEVNYLADEERLLLPCFHQSQ
jgi:hypothetical protein